MTTHDFCIWPSAGPRTPRMQGDLLYGWVVKQECLPSGNWRVMYHNGRTTGVKEMILTPTQMAKYNAGQTVCGVTAHGFWYALQRRDA